MRVFNSLLLFIILSGLFMKHFKLCTKNEIFYIEILMKNENDLVHMNIDF
jgi:hypothetical protein